MDTIKSFNMAIRPTITRPGIVICILFLVGVCLVVPASGGTYYVSLSGNDSNPGTESQPWRSIEKAANTMAAGDTVYIRTGTYQEQVIPLNSGSAGNYITYAAFPGETVTIDGAGISLPNWGTGLFELDTKSYIKISGLRIVNAGPNDNNAGIYVDNSHHIIIENNYTYNTVSSGIGVWDGNNIIIDGNEVRLACNDGEQEDITVSGTDTFEIKNNHAHEGGPGTNGGEGITVKGGATNGKIYQNHVHDITRGQRTALYVDGWGDSKATSNIEIYQNIFHNCGAGISLASEDGSLVRDIKIYNNIVYDNQSNGLEIGNWGEPGVTTRPVESITFINNTVHHNGFGTWGGGFYNENPNAKDIVVRNNIFSQNSVSQIVNESTTTLTVDHNLIDGSQEYTYAITGANYVEGDPLFIDPANADFHLQAASPAIDRGSSVDAPGSDYDGTTRPQSGGIDIGAFEFPSDPSAVDEHTDGIPTAFQLFQNYPNPFNPRTSISFEIAGGMGSGVRVQLSIYNVQGQVVRTLVDEEKSPGVYTAHWGGRNDSGERVSSGLYLYTIIAGDFKATRKMVILR